MKTYIPKKGELEKMGFTYYKNEGVHTFELGTLTLECDLPFWTIFDGENINEIFPQSKSDIQKLLKLFIKPN